MAQTKVKLIADGVIVQGNLHASHGITTADIGENASYLYYTDARVSNYLSTNGYDTATNIIASITDSAPSTLDTLNELAAALGDDANFSTTVTNSIATKLPLTGGTMTGDITISSTSPELKFVDTNSFTDTNDRWIVRGGADTLIMRWYDNSASSNTDVLTLSSTAATFSGDVTIGDNKSIISNGSVRIDIDNDNDSTTRAFIVRNDGGTNELFRVQEDGNAGIGTASPERKLHVFKGESGGATSNSDSSLVLENSSNTYLQFLTPTTVESGILFGDTDNDVGAFTYSHSTNSFNFRTAGVSNRMVIDSSGNVGIGITTIARGPLHVHKGSTGYSQVHLTNSSSGSTSNDGLTLFTNGNDAGIMQRENSYLLFGTNDTERMRIDSSGNLLLKGGYISLNTNDDSRISGDGDSIDFILWDNSSAYQTRMTILDTGNVGIGTTSPSTLLHLNKPTAGDAMLTIQSTSSGDPGITMITTNDRTGNIFYKDGSAASTQRKFTYDHAAQAFKMFAHNTTVVDFYASETLAYFPTQDVGIGTTSPATKLDVKGCVAMGAAIHDGNIAYSSSGFGHQNGGSLHINYSLSGVTSSGDTITFTYAATNWKSWSLKYNFASTSGITQGVVGGYWNNSGSSGNYIAYNQHGVSVAVTHTGQGNTVTFTFTALGTHPMANFVYIQGGGDGQPRADRVTLSSST